MSLILLYCTCTNHCHKSCSNHMDLRKWSARGFLYKLRKPTARCYFLEFIIAYLFTMLNVVRLGFKLDVANVYSVRTHKSTMHARSKTALYLSKNIALYIFFLIVTFILIFFSSILLYSEVHALKACATLIARSESKRP